ncbi:replicase protein [Cape gooseberry ilarvirus 1]|uniref:replicase protein n=1 Tax=Cape gooseberry ilarvirus 1 TaxID=2116599 RepID=UPI000D21A253|nr:replicase protein [Cape gooseberry ilarvirus 1]AVN67117.1 replicase protein [Cape gooseberry ilarvirus 1]
MDSQCSTSSSSRSCVPAVDINNLVASYIEHVKADDNSNVSRFLGEVALRELKSQVDTSNGDFQKLNVGFRLSPDEKNALKNSFPGLEIVFKDSCQSSHSFAAAHRVCESLDIYKRFNTKTEKIIDLGGNYVTHTRHGRANVHSCCPILNVRDAARHTDRYMSLAAAVEKHHRELPVDFCCKKFEECNVQAPYAMAIHSISDIPIATVARHCIRRGVRKLIASIMMDPAMMLYDSGRIPLLNVVWEKEDVVEEEGITLLKEGKKKTLIHFHFVDAPGLSYTHDFSILSQYMVTNQVIVGGGYSYRVERTADLNGVYIVELTLGMTDGMTLNHLRPLTDISCAWLANLRKKVFVKIAVPVSTEWFTEDFEMRWALMDESIVRYVSEAAFRQYSKTKDPETVVQHIATMLSSSSNHVVINGITMRSGSPVAIEEYVPLAVTFYTMAAWRYKMIAPGIEAVKTRVKKNIDLYSRNSEPTLSDALVEMQKSVLPDDDFGLKNCEKIPDVIKSVGLRCFKGKSLKKVGDDVSRLRSHSMFREVLHEIREFFGLTITGEDFNFVEATPAKLKSTTVWEAFAHNMEFPACLDVSECSYDLMNKHLATKAEDERVEKQTREFLDARDRALITIAKVIEKNEVPDGLMPILNLLDVEKELMTAKNSLSLTPEAVNTIHDNDQSLIVNPYAESIKEAIHYFNELEMVNTRNLRTLGQYIGWRPSDPTTYRALKGRNESVKVFIPFENKWYPDNKDLQTYERAMTEDGYVSLQWDKDGSLTPTCIKSISKYNALVVDDSCVFNAGQSMIPALESALKLKPNFKVKIVDGVAGCGKTTYLRRISNFLANPDLILTSNRSSSDELKETIDCSEAMKYRIRTIDSYLMLKNWFASDRLLFDECFLTHAGCIYAAATLAQVKEVIALGDTEQVPFISRLPEFRMQHHKLTGDIEVQTVTYRCPRDATYCLKSQFYKNKSVKSASLVERSLELCPINSAVQIPCEEDVLYITHTRADKDVLLKIPGFKKENIKTTHEAQGETWDKVVLFRLSKTTNLLHSGKGPELGPCHNLVAISRHKKSLRYYTVAPNDLDDQILRCINISKTLSSRDLDAVRVASTPR